MYQPVVRENIERVNPETAAGLGTLGVATVHEAAGRSGLLDPALRPIAPASQIAGSAVTVLCPPGDNLMIHFAVEQCQPGDVLVVAVTSMTTDAMIGELLATSLRAHGVIGAVIDAGVRDVADLRKMDFPVWSRAISAQGTVKATLGCVNVPVVCAGQLVDAGDVIAADDDGVVRVPRAEASRVLRAASERSARERETRKRLADGELGVDINRLREKVDRLGLTYEGGDERDRTPRERRGKNDALT